MAETKKKRRAAPKSKAAKTASAANRKATKAGPAPTAEAAAEAPPVAPAPKPAAAAPGVSAASPLDGRPGTGAEGAVMVEHPHLGKITLRGDAGDPVLANAVKEAVGADLPLEPNTVAAGSGNAVLWLGPDEWLVVTPVDGQAPVQAALTEALEGRHAAIVDTSDARTTIRLHGARARDVLMKGCPLDLHPRAFGPGRSAQTLIGNADVLIHQRDDKPTYDIYVLCSFARYLWDWLVDAAKEFG